MGEHLCFLLEQQQQPESNIHFSVPTKSQGEVKVNFEQVA